MNVAIYDGDQEEVLSIVSNGYDYTSEIDDKNQTVLHVAAYAGHYELVEYFLGMDDLNIDAIDSHGWTPLLCAASCGHVRICLLLLKRGANPELANDQKTTVLHYLARKCPPPESSKGKKRNSNEDEYFRLLEEILDKGIDINAKNFMGETPLMQACARSNETAVKFLLDRKAKYKLTNDSGSTAYYYAENANAGAIVKILDERIEKDRKKNLVTHKDLKMDNYKEVVSLMKDPDSGVQLKDRKQLFITHRNCCSGSDIVDWVMLNFGVTNRIDASEYCQKLLDHHWICEAGVNPKMKFKDSNRLYRFNESGEAPADLPNPQEKIGVDSFDFLKTVGKGGFGKVVKAQKKDTKKIYAIKVMEKAHILKKERDFKNLMSERKILQNNSCFLVHLHYAFQTETDFYLVMDFMDGGDLHYHWKSAQRRFPEKVVQFLSAQLVLALSYLHSCGVIYRDLKPQNILLDSTGNICLADFGLSKEVASETMAHTACGTPTYSAPEVLEASPYNKSIDYWSLGIVIYQLLVGKPPFEYTGDFAKLLKSITSGKIQYPQELLSENAVLLLQGLLQRDPQKRLDDPDIIKRHPFFKGIDWEKLSVKKVSSPIKISTKDNKNLDPRYTSLPVTEDKEKQVRPKIDNFTMEY